MRLGKEILGEFYRKHVDRRLVLEERRNEKIRAFENERRAALNGRRGPWKINGKERRELLRDADIFPKSEVEHVFEWKGHFLRTKMDLVYRPEGGGLAVTDFKTNKHIAVPGKDVPITQKPYQLGTYHLAVEDRYGEEPVDRSLYFLRKGKRISVPVTAGHFELLDKDLAKAEGIVRRGLKEGFEKNTGPHCSWCDCYKPCLEDAKTLLPPQGPWSEDEIEQYWSEVDFVP
jgi:CRISPR/Cas system-associated exonuclease Cas4 (RecB family)